MSIRSTSSSRFASLMKLPEGARLIASRLRHALKADAVYLFGSYARGEATEDSDLDFLVVVPKSSQTRYARNVEAREIVGDIPLPKDIIVLTRSEWEAERGLVCSLAGTVAREGIAL